MNYQELKPWHVSMARYSKKQNAIAERRVKDFKTCDEGLEYLNLNSDKPIYLWHTQAVELENPYFAMVETDIYKLEYRKFN